MVWREEPRSCSFTLHGDQFVSAVYNPNAARRGKEREGRGRKEAAKLTRAWLGSTALCSLGFKPKGKVWGSLLYTRGKKPTWSSERSWWSRTAARPCVYSCCCCIQRSHETRRLREGPPPSLPPFLAPSHVKWKLWQSGGEKRRRRSACVKVPGNASVSSTVFKMKSPTWEN